MTRVSISQVSRVPAETAALAELKNTHLGKVLFLRRQMPGDGLGRPLSTMHLWKGLVGGWGAGGAEVCQEKHFHFTPRMH